MTYYQEWILMTFKNINLIHKTTKPSENASNHIMTSCHYVNLPVKLQTLNAIIISNRELT